jgi:hypothetical protein
MRSKVPRTDVEAVYCTPAFRFDERMRSNTTSLTHCSHFPFNRLLVPVMLPLLPFEELAVLSTVPNPTVVIERWSLCKGTSSSTCLVPLITVVVLKDRTRYLRLSASSVYLAVAINV